MEKTGSSDEEKRENKPSEEKVDAVTRWLLFALFTLGILCIGGSVLLEALGCQVPKGLLEIGSAIVGSLIATWRFRTIIATKAVKDCSNDNPDCPLRKKK